MTHLRTYRKPHSSKLNQAEKAKADYQNGIYENKNSSFSPEFQEYQQTYKDLTLAEPLEQTA